MANVGDKTFRHHRRDIACSAYVNSVHRVPIMAQTLSPSSLTRLASDRENNLDVYFSLRSKPPTSPITWPPTTRLAAAPRPV